MTTGKKHRSDIEIAADDLRITSLRLQGLSHRAIAEDVGLSHAEVGRTLKRILAEWKKQSSQNIETQISEKEAMLYRVMNTAWMAYERSIGEVRKEIRKVKRAGQGGNAPAAEVTVTTEELNGDPRYLTIIENCIRDLRDLKGLDAPKRSEIAASITPKQFAWADAEVDPEKEIE